MCIRDRVIGLFINFIGIDPIKALVFTAVFNGIAAVPLIFVIIKISGNNKIMGEYKSGKLSRSLLITTFITMTTSVILMFIALLSCLLYTSDAADDLTRV